MMKVNCDLGERGLNHPVDVELMRYVHIANIACGGHAGDAETAMYYQKLAGTHGVMVTAHLSYPDRENFGRFHLNISDDALCDSLNAQMQAMPGVAAVKFHGALYNDSVINAGLASILAQWAKRHGIDTLLALDDSEMALACRQNGIHVITEAFAERRYTINPGNNRLQLVDRKKDYASIHDCVTAIRQSRDIVFNHQVATFVETAEGTTVQKPMTIHAETICIHSDAPIALELARGLAAINESLV